MKCFIINEVYYLKSAIMEIIENVLLQILIYHTYE